MTMNGDRQSGARERDCPLTAAAAAVLLKFYFPALDTEEPMDGGDTVARLASLYGFLRGLGEASALGAAGRNFDHPVQHAVDVFLADGGSASELLWLVAEVASYAGPQRRPDDTDHGGEYDGLADELEAAAGRLKVLYG